MFTFNSSKLLLIHKISAPSIVTPFLFYRLCTAIESRQCLKDKSPTNINGSPSYVVSYLIDSCGLSPESAKLASRKLKFESPEKPDAVLKLLKNYGFDKTHISRLIRGCPYLLMYNSKKTLLPKLQFFNSIGLSKFSLATLLSFRANILVRSLENHIIPLYKFLRKVLGSDKKVVTFFKCMPLYFDIRYLVPNITALRELNVPESSVMLLTTYFPMVILQRHDQFLEVVSKVKEMGFDPLEPVFVHVIRALSGNTNRLIWDRCFEVYKKWGWSEDDILLAFKKHPQCMVLSTDKIDRAMDFFVNKMGYQPKALAKMPNVLFYSLEKRIIPRCSVIQVLTSKGLMTKVNLRSVMSSTDMVFLKRFVTMYEDRLPQLMSVFEGKMDTL